MLWRWIDQIIEYEAGARLVTVKNVTRAEEHLADHFGAEGDLGAFAVMPASLMIEGMAQTAGLLVGATGGFAEKVILAKIVKARFDDDVLPAQVLRYTATLDRFDAAGASTQGVIHRMRFPDETWEAIGSVDLIFSHLDQNLAGATFPEENFVFSEGFKSLLRDAGLDTLVDQAASHSG